MEYNTIWRFLLIEGEHVKKVSILLIGTLRPFSKHIFYVCISLNIYIGEITITFLRAS